MIPLPDWIQFRRIKIIAVDEEWLGVLRVASVRLNPGIRGFADITRQTDNREILVPGNRDERHHPADAAVVLHDDAPPFTGRCIDDSALMKCQAAARIGVAVCDREGLIRAPTTPHSILTWNTKRFATHHSFDFPWTVN